MISLFAVSQKQKHELMGFSKPSKYQYGAGAMTFAKFFSGGIGAVRVYDVLAQPKTELFLRKKLAIAIVDGSAVALVFGNLLVPVSQ